MAEEQINKIKFVNEYVFNSCSLRVLWNSISTPGGLQEWFADKVVQNKHNWSFEWNGTVQNARMVFMHSDMSVRFRWEGEPSYSFFEMRISVDELANNVILVITDFAYADEVEDNKLLWDKQVEQLRKYVGVE